MYSENDKQYSRRRTGEEFLRRMQGEEFLSRTCAGRDTPVMAQGMLPAVDERPKTACNGTKSNSGTGCNMPSLAMVYSPVQSFSSLLAPADALDAGSLFADLVKPLEVGGAKCQLGGGYRK